MARTSRIRRTLQILSLGVFLGLFFYAAWPYADVFSSDVVPRKRWLPLELFLWLDPLVGISAGVAARHWNVAVLGAAVVFLLGLFFRRWFCGYLCPLGTLIDLFDWLVGRRIGLRKRWQEGFSPLGECSWDS